MVLLLPTPFTLKSCVPLVCLCCLEALSGARFLQLICFPDPTSSSGLLGSLLFLGWSWFYILVPHGTAWDGWGWFQWTGLVVVLMVLITSLFSPPKNMHVYCSLFNIHCPKIQIQRDFWQSLNNRNQIYLPHVQLKSISSNVWDGGVQT